MKRIWDILNYSKDVRIRIFGAISTTVVFKFLDMTPGFLIGVIIDLIIHKDKSFIASIISYQSSSLIYFLVFAIIGTWIVSALCQYCASLLWRGAGRNLHHAMRLSLFDHVQHLPMSWLEQNSGSTIEALTHDINQVENFVSRALDEIIQMCISVLLLWIIVSLVDVRFLWCVVFPVPLLIIFILYVRPKVKLVYQQGQKRARRFSSVLHRYLGSFLDIKSLAQENLSLKEMSQISLSIKQGNKETGNFVSALMPVTKFIVICGVIAVLIYGGQLVISNKINAGIFTSLFFLSQRFLWPLCSIGRIVDTVSRFLTSLEHIYFIKKLEKEDVGIEGDIPVQFDRMSLENISFGYENKKLFENLNAEFYGGEITAIQGASGIGKTTLSLCMLRIYNVNYGVIKIGNASIEHIPLNQLRRFIGYVPQHPKLFCGTLLENIALDDPLPNRLKIGQLLKDLGLNSLIDKLEINLHTESAQQLKLSGGQLQRIAIARVIYRDPKILIFDEATSGLDSETELNFLTMLNKIKNGRIILFISHRNSIRDFADRIYQFKDGNLLPVTPRVPAYYGFMPSQPAA